MEEHQMQEPTAAVNVDVTDNGRFRISTEDETITLTEDQLEEALRLAREARNQQPATAPGDDMVITVQPDGGGKLPVSPAQWAEALMSMPWDWATDGESWITEMDGNIVGVEFHFHTLDEDEPEDAPVAVTATCMATMKTGKRNDVTVPLSDEVLATAQMTVLVREPKEHRKLVRTLKGLE